MEALILAVIRHLGQLRECSNARFLQSVVDLDMLRFLLSLTMLVSVVSMILGFIIMLYPGFIADLSRHISNISEKVDLLLNKNFRVERWFYRKHKLYGASIMFMSSYFLFYYLIIYNSTFAYHYFSSLYDPKTVEWLLSSMEFLFVFLITLTFMFGGVFYLRPSLIKHIERIGNTWISTDDDEVIPPTHHYPSRWLGFRVFIGNFNFLLLFTFILFTNC